MATPTLNFVPATNFNVNAAQWLGESWSLLAGSKWGGSPGVGAVLTYSFPAGQAWFLNGYSEFNDWSALSGLEQGLVRFALDKWQAVANVSFLEVADYAGGVGELRFAVTGTLNPSGDTQAIAWAYYPGTSPASGDVWFKRGVAVTEHTVMHEIGHALGLKHPFDLPNVLSPQHDSFFFSIMSYTASPWSTKGDSSASIFPTTLMYGDLVAIQALYGRNYSHNASDTTYVFDGDYGQYFETIDDAGGSDWIIVNGLRDCVIDLRQAHFSSVGAGGYFGNVHYSNGYFIGDHYTNSTVCIGPNTLIENAVGGAGVNVIIGNDLHNWLGGSAGTNIISGGAGNDFIVGGFTQTDVASYTDAMSAVTVNLGNTGAQRTGSGSGVDRLISIEHLLGSSFDDWLLGDGSSNQLIGYAGNDNILGGSGNDILDGGQGVNAIDGGLGLDTASYGTSGVNVSVNLGIKAFQSTSTVSVDRLLSIESVSGSQYGDILIGDLVANQLYGQAGNDKLFGADGNDTVTGGAGDDFVGGGLGSDVFVFGFTNSYGNYGAEGVDIVTDFQNGVDKLNVLVDFGKATFKNLLFAQQGSDAIVYFPVELDFFGNATAMGHFLLKNVNVQTLDYSDFIF